MRNAYGVDNDRGIKGMGGCRIKDHNSIGSWVNVYHTRNMSVNTDLAWHLLLFFSCIMVIMFKPIYRKWRWMGCVRSATWHNRFMHIDGVQ